MFSFVLILMSVGFAVAGRQKLAASGPADEDLMKRYAQGDVQAFELLYQRHRKPVFHFILRYVKSPEHAEELLQDVFMRLIQHAPKYATQAKFTTWLYTIARNICIDSHRRQQHRQTVSLQKSLGGSTEEDGLTLEGLLPDLDAEDGGENLVFQREFQKELERGLASLPDSQREVFLLREISQLPYQEIAQIVGTLENTVKSRMRYALEGLRKHLESAGFSTEDLQR